MMKMKIFICGFLIENTSLDNYHLPLLAVSFNLKLKEIVEYQPYSSYRACCNFMCLIEHKNHDIPIHSLEMIHCLPHERDGVGYR